MKKLLLIDDEENMLHMLTAYLSRQGYEVSCASDGSQGLDMLREGRFDIILCDLKMPVMGGVEFLRRAKGQGIDSIVIMMSAYATVDTAVEAMKLGAYDFVTKPFKIDEILCVLQRAEELEALKHENQQLRQQVDELQGPKGFEHIVGESKSLRDVVELARRVAPYDTPVLISGESGTGKELFAKGIHSTSPRAGKRFVAVNCGSIPENLLESEFFGYKKGAFTGADSDKHGLFVEAHGGTLFLDEIGELPLSLQVKLLRVLQEKEVRPIGSNVQHKVDVRVIAATAKRLAEEVEKGTFRQDLFYRLNVVEISLPPLRDRHGDIRVLANHFISKYSETMNVHISGILPEACTLLERYSWPGNIRELENTIEHALIYAEEGVISSAAFPLTVRTSECSVGQEIFETYSVKEGKVLLERHLIRKALARTEGNKSQAAELLEISYPSLLSKIKDYEIVDF